MPNPLSALPSPDTVRRCLCETETQLRRLRALLRAVEAVERADRPRRPKTEGRADG